MTQEVPLNPVAGLWQYVSTAEAGQVSLQIKIQKGFASAERVAQSASGRVARSTAADRFESADLPRVVNWLRAQHQAMEAVGWKTVRRSGAALRLDLTAPLEELEEPARRRGPRVAGGTGALGAAQKLGIPCAPQASLGMRTWGMPSPRRDPAAESEEQVA